LRPKTAALGFVGALVASAFASGSSSSPVGFLRVGWDNHSDMTLAGAVTGSSDHLKGHGHPVIDSVAPVSMLSTAARHVPAAAAGPRCDDSQLRGNVSKYQGRSVSSIYDQLFRPAASVPYLGNYIPQALDAWDNWDGQGHDLVLLGMYRTGHQSYLVGLNPETGDPVGTVMVDESHLGGMAFFGDWLFTGDNPWPKVGSPTVEKYRTADLQAAMQQSITGKSPVYLKSDGPRQNIDATDFMSVDGDSLYTGNHGNAGVPGLMNRYTLDPDGTLKKVEGPWVVPDRAQGLIITPDDFVFSTDNNTGRGELVVVRRTGPSTLKSPVACVWMPAMPEDLTVHDGKVWTVFESGSPRFNRDHPVNRITHLHSGSLDSLLSAVDPIAFDAEKALGIAPTNPLPSLPSLPTVPLLPGNPVPGTPSTPLLPGLGNLPLVGGLASGLTTGGITPTTNPAAGPAATTAPSAAPAPAAEAPALIPAPLPGPAPASVSGNSTDTLKPAAPEDPAAPPAGPPAASAPLTSILTPSATPAPGASPGVELWLPTDRVSDAFDLYNSQLTKPDTQLTPLPGGRPTVAPTDMTTPAGSSDSSTTTDSSAMSARAPIMAPAADGATTTDTVSMHSSSSTVRTTPRRISSGSSIAVLPAADGTATTATTGRVSDARDLYEHEQANQTPAN
jgi:hypothetical protein